MVRAFQLAEQGTLALDERVTLTRALLRDGTGIFQYADLGLSPTLRDLIQQMIVTSDNTATDIMTTRVGAVEGLKAWLAASGYRLRMINRGWEYRRRRPCRSRRSVTPERKIESPRRTQKRRRCVGKNSRHAVVLEARRAAEDEDIAGFEHQGLDGIAPARAAKEEPGRVTKRHRDDRPPCLE